MGNNIPDYTNLKANLSSMNRFFNDQGINLTNSEKAQIKTIFDKANVVKEKDKNVEEQLSVEERISFMEKLKQTLPNIYDKIVDFFTTVEIVEDNQKIKQETYENLKKELHRKDIEEQNVTFGLD